MPKPSLKVAKKAPFAVELMDDHAIGLELTALYNDANDGFRRVLRFGAAFLYVESRVTACDTHNNTARKGGGMKGWLEKYAPDVARSTAYKYRDIAEAVALKFHIADPALCFGTDQKALPPAEQAKREKAIEFVAGKSLNGVQMELGLKNAPTPKPIVQQAALTPEQEHEEFIKAARARAVTAFSELHTLGERWQLLPDEQLTLAATNAAAFAKAAKAWLATAPLQRAAFDVARHLAADNAAEDESAAE